jgi:hypothetical protein
LATEGTATAGSKSMDASIDGVCHKFDISFDYKPCVKYNFHSDHGSVVL